VVTTNFFAFDDSTDYYKLQGLGRGCDMGDAMVGNALQSFPHSWYSIRNASDPQIPNPNNTLFSFVRREGLSYFTPDENLDNACSVTRAFNIDPPLRRARTPMTWAGLK
jgi:hypothetical protein